MSSDAAERIDAVMVLDTVTAFPDRAQLQYRTAQPLTLAAGPHVLVFRTETGSGGGDRIWSEMDGGSLQVRVVSDGSASSRVLLRDVGQVTRTVRTAATEDVEQKRLALAGVRATIARVKREEEVLKGSRRYVEKLRTRVAAPVGEAAEAGEAARAFFLDPAAWSGMGEFLSSTTKRCERETLALQEQLEEAQVRERALEQELGDLREDPDTQLYYRSRTETTVEATVEVREGEEEPAAAVSLVLSFVAPGVAWSPAYDLRVNREEQTMEMSYFAKVSQRTGVDWADVALRLSTAKPSLGAAPPYDEGRWEITLDPPPRPVMRCLRSAGPQRRAGRAFGMAAATANAAPMAFDEADAAMPEAMMEEEMAVGPIARRADVAARGSGATASTFVIAGRVSVPTGDREVRVCITVERLPVRLRFTCTPKLDPLVYLSAVATNTTPYELLSGPANIFFNQTFVCTAVLPAVVADGGEIKVSLGADESVKVKRQQLERRVGDVQRASLFSTAKRASVHYAYLFEVIPEVAHSEIRVVDQYPVHTHQDMAVTLEDPKVPKPSKGNKDAVDGVVLRQGLTVAVDELHQVTWTLSDAPPHETQRFRLAFTAGRHIITHQTLAFNRSVSILYQSRSYNDAGELAVTTKHAAPYTLHIHSCLFCFILPQIFFLFVSPACHHLDFLRDHTPQICLHICAVLHILTTRSTLAPHSLVVSLFARVLRFTYFFTYFQLFFFAHRQVWPYPSPRTRLRWATTLRLVCCSHH
eukprot:gene8097-5633_t